MRATRHCNVILRSAPELVEGARLEGRAVAIFGMLLLSSCVPKPVPHRVAHVPYNVYAYTRAGMLSPTVAGDKYLVYVPNSTSNTVSVIDPRTYKVLRTFGSGGGAQHVTPAWNLKTLYVDVTGGNRLIPIDPRTGLPGRPIRVTDPYNLYFTPDGSRAIVVAEGYEALDIRDPTSWKLLAHVPMPCSGPNHGDFTVDNRYFILSCEFSGHLLKLDLKTLRVVNSLFLGGAPVDVRISPDGKLMYVANEGTRFGGVHVIDPLRLRAVGYIKTGAGAHGLLPSRDGLFLYVTNRLGHSISVIDFAKRKVVQTWPIPNGSPDMGGVTPNGSRLWVSGRFDSEVYVLETTHGRLLARIPVGSGPHGLCLFPQPGRYSVGHTGNYR